MKNLCAMTTKNRATATQAGLKGQENFEERFKNFDKNGYGKLTREEFVGPSAK